MRKEASEEGSKYFNANAERRSAHPANRCSKSRKNRIVEVISIPSCRSIDNNLFSFFLRYGIRGQSVTLSSASNTSAGTTTAGRAEPRTSSHRPPLALPSRFVVRMSGSQSRTRRPHLTPTLRLGNYSFTARATPPPEANRNAGQPLPPNHAPIPSREAMHPLPRAREPPTLRANKEPA